MAILVTSGVPATATVILPQRKTFFPNGYYWLFYSNGTDIVYKTSTDNVTWSNESTAQTGLTDGSLFDVRFYQINSHLYVFFVWVDNDLGAIRFKRGEINGNSISWGTSYLVEDEADVVYKNPVVEVGTDGALYIGAHSYYDGGTYPLYWVVWRNPNNEGAVANADFGYNTAGASIHAVSGNNKIGCLFKAPRTESITKIYAYLRPGLGVISLSARAGIYNDNTGVPGSRASASGESTEQTIIGAAAWYEFIFATPIPVVKDNYYWLSIIGSDNFRIYYDAGNTNQTAVNADTYSDGFADPWGGGTSYFTEKLSIYASATGAWTAYSIHLFGTYQSLITAYGILLRLTSGRVYTIYTDSGVTYTYGTLWNGSAWESEETILSGFQIVQLPYYSFSASPIGDDVYFGYVKSLDNKPYFKWRDYDGGGWQTEENVYNGTVTGVSLTVDSATGDVYIYWSTVIYDNIVYAKRSSGVWQSPVTLVTTTSVIPLSITTFVDAVSNYVGVGWVRGTTPYYLWYELHNLAPAPPPAVKAGLNIPQVLEIILADEG